MKRSVLAFPCVAAVAAAVVLAAGPLRASGAQGAGALQFEARFSAPSDFAEQFDYGYSGNNPFEAPLHGGDAITTFHGDHDMDCGAPTTSREVSFGGDVTRLDYSQIFWACLPGGDPQKGHVMTGVDTHEYNIAWFSPKRLFTDISKVCWDQNLTTMSLRKWTQVAFISEADSLRYPADPVENPDYSVKRPTRGSAGYDLGFVGPDFRDLSGVTTGILPEESNAGIKIVDGSALWWQDDAFTSPGFGDLQALPEITDKATRYRHCVENLPGDRVRITQDTPDGVRTADATGQIPSGSFRVVFEDDNYNPPKDERYQADVLTWHWDNIEVAAASSTDALAGSPSTVPPSTGGAEVLPEDRAAATATEEAIAVRTSGTGVDATPVLLALAGLALLVIVAVVRVRTGPFGSGGRDPADPAGQA